MTLQRYGAKIRMQNLNCKQMLIQFLLLKIIYKALIYNIISIELTITILIQSLKYYNQNQPSVTFVHENILQNTMIYEEKHVCLNLKMNRFNSSALELWNLMLYMREK